MSAKQKICTVMDLPTKILASLFAPLMFAELPNHSTGQNNSKCRRCALEKQKESNTSPVTFSVLSYNMKIVFGFYEPKIWRHFWIRRNSVYESKSSLQMLCRTSKTLFIRVIKIHFSLGLFVWNELPRNIVEAGKLQHFKSKLKWYLNI